ncbi:hypothetical protein Bbelb_405380 [Branchiostoma belcheri]|nr:hypothetical protein Bbelb_405380 [Branchiostoma belcheri]
MPVELVRKRLQFGCGKLYPPEPGRSRQLSPRPSNPQIESHVPYLLQAVLELYQDRNCIQPVPLGNRDSLSFSLGPIQSTAIIELNHNVNLQADLSVGEDSIGTRLLKFKYRLLNFTLPPGLAP